MHPHTKHTSASTRSDQGSTMCAPRNVSRVPTIPAMHNAISFPPFVLPAYPVDKQLARWQLDWTGPSQGADHHHHHQVAIAITPHNQGDAIGPRGIHQIMQYVNKDDVLYSVYSCFTYHVKRRLQCLLLVLDNFIS